MATRLPILRRQEIREGRSLSASTEPIVTIAFIPRERFSRAADALRQLIENTAEVPFKLIIVDCKTPERYRRDVEAVVRGRENVCPSAPPTDWLVRQNGHPRKCNCLQ